MQLQNEKNCSFGDYLAVVFQSVLETDQYYFKIKKLFIFVINLFSTSKKQKLTEHQLEVNDDDDDDVASSLSVVPL